MRKAIVALLVVCWVLPGTAAGQTPHDPITIRSDQAFTERNGVVSGTGLPEDPYVIEGWRINADGADYGILIHGTTRSFVVRDVSIRGARRAGIRLTQTRDGKVQDAQVTGCATGVYIHSARRIILRELSVSHCDDGIRIFWSLELKVERTTLEHAQAALWGSGVGGLLVEQSTFDSCAVGLRLDVGSEGNTVTENAFLNCRIPAYSEGDTRFHREGRGNFWQGHKGSDDDGDGVLDTAHHVEGGEDKDPFPLASPP